MPSPWWTTSKNEVKEYAPIVITIDIPLPYYGIGPPNRRFSGELGLGCCENDYEHNHLRRDMSYVEMMQYSYPVNDNPAPSMTTEQLRRIDIKKYW